MYFFGITSTQAILLSALWALFAMPLFGFLGAVFLRWSMLLLEMPPVRYWMAYKVNTLGSMAVVVFLVPVQFVTNRLGGLGFFVYVAFSIFGLALFYSRWIRTADGQIIGLQDASWLSLLQSGLWLLVSGVFFGLSAAMAPGHTALGTVLAIACAALFVGVATISMSRSTPTKPVRNITWNTEDIAALHRHATDEFERGERDEELWVLATIARSDPDQRRDWYLSERVKKLRLIAEDQLRREGTL